MQRIDTANKAVDLFGVGKHGFKDGNQSLGISATDLNAAIFNSFQEELASVIEGAGIALDPLVRTQLDTAIKTLLSKSTFTSAGAAPAFTLTPLPAITGYAAGQRFRVKFHASGTTGSNTLNISGIGAKNLKQYDAFGAKVAAMVVSGQLTDVEYDGVDMVILSPLMVKFSRLPTAVTDWQELPNGLILQWGVSTSLAQNASQTITFPIAFPASAMWVVSAPEVAAGTGSAQSSGSIVLSSTQLSVTNTSGSAITFRIFWAAIGR